MQDEDAALGALAELAGQLDRLGDVVPRVHGQQDGAAYDFSLVTARAAGRVGLMC